MKLKLKKSKTPVFNMDDPVGYIKHVEYHTPVLTNARNLMCRGNYSQAIIEFRHAQELLPGSDDQTLIAKSLAYCMRAEAGIQDLREHGGSIFHNGVKITEEEMKYILKYGKPKSGSSSESAKTRKPRVSIGNAILNLFREQGVELEYEKAESLALQVNPSSKFNKQHYSYYRAIYKAELRKQGLDVPEGKKSTKVTVPAKPRLKIRKK